MILFIPEAGIYPYMRGLSILGDAVQKQGGKVFVTHDTGQMLRSPIMAMYKTSIDISKSDKAKIPMQQTTIAQTANNENVRRN